MISKSFTTVAVALQSASPWSVKVARKSDNQTCMVLDYTGTFLFGPIGSKDKGDFTSNYVKLTTFLISANNWFVCTTDCKWDE